MTEIKYILSYEKNSNLVVSVEEFKKRWLFGIPIKDQEGNLMDSNTIKHFLRAAQEEVERYFNIKLKKQIIEEDKDFNRDEYSNWGFIRTTYPVNEGIKLEGFISNEQQITYPKEWLSSKKASDGKLFERILNLVPGGNTTTQTNSAVFNGITPHLGFFGNMTIPNYWRIRYCTGFDIVPNELVEVMGKLAAISVFNILGDLILGAGIASQSVSLDGLSQSIATTSSATNSGYGARIGSYQTDLKKSLNDMKHYYTGFKFTTL